jgi:hypothetical protein
MISDFFIYSKGNDFMAGFKEGREERRAERSVFNELPDVLFKSGSSHKAFSFFHYPNPVSRYFILDCNLQPYDILLINQEGKIIRRYEYKEKTEYDLELVKDGLYFLLLEVDGHGSVIRKIMVKKD